MSFGTTMGLLTLGSFLAFVLVLLYAMVARREKMDAAARIPLEDDDSALERALRGERR